MDICFLTCICLWQISQIQTCLFKVVGPGLVSTSPVFVSSSATQPAGPHAQTTINRAPIAGGRKGSTQFAQQHESAVTAPPLVGCVVWSFTSPSGDLSQQDNNNNNNCLKSNIQCIEIRVQWTVHLGSSHMHVHAVTRVHAVTPKLVICVMYLTSI